MSGNPDDIVAHRKDGTPITRAEWTGAETKVLGEEKAKESGNPNRLLKYFRKEKLNVDEQAKPPIKIEEEEVSLAVLDERTEDSLLEPELIPDQKFELVRTKGMELGLIKRFKLIQKIDYYEIAGKMIFTKEGMGKFMPFLTIDGYKVSYKVVEVIDEPNYKYVRVRSFLGPEDQPIQMAEGSCDWREENSWQETIAEKIKKTLDAEKYNNRVDPNRELFPNDIDYNPETGKVVIIDTKKQFYIAYDHLRKRMFALRVAEGKAIRRAFSHLTGLSSTSSEELNYMETEAKILNEEVAS